ncbi:MAG: type III PLP-dependent enzyme [Bauldia sp.]|uniref:type III PLP-dependent enzyme n=1 Tax=Bauldia sp. TaxID=2575872 RepID=UPI001D79FDCA|nr:type III PLP-dependent enzyme [Bauldia sp.]MCB1497689.1 type III PLP-dependent enzyme [Bauldia sp.]
MTDRIRDFLRLRRPEGPCLVVDLDVVRDNYLNFARALPDSRVFYAVKANPDPAVLKLLAGLGSNFDCASVAEIDMARNAGATADRISYGNTIKKERDIAAAHNRGVRLFAVDCVEEVGKIARAAPGARVFCRILCDCDGAEWPLSRKFGCDPEMAIDVLEHAHGLGLEAHGVSFHVGSQQPNPEAWDVALKASASIFRTLSERGIQLRMVNLGGGFPAKYVRDVPAVKSYGQAIFTALRRHFGNRIPETIIEPGRGMVGEAGVIKAEVVLISKKSAADPVRWVYLDIGKFGGLAETMDEAIRYPIRTPRDGEATEPCVLAGPTCDSADVLYEKTPYELPVSLAIGDEVLIEGTGAYTQTYSAVAFNGFDPLKSYVI